VRQRFVRRKYLVVLFGALLVAIMSAFAYCYRPWETHYKWLPTSYWASRCLAGRVDTQSFFLGGQGSRTFWLFATEPSPQAVWQKWLAAIGIRIGLSNDSEPEVLSGDPAAIPVLRELLRDRSVRVRQAAVYGIYAARKTSSDVKDVLESAAGDEDANVRCLVDEALSYFKPEPADRPRANGQDLPTW
jgi:hypothetical protein